MPAFTVGRNDRKLTLLDSSIERSPVRSTLTPQMSQQVCMLPADQADFERVLSLFTKILKDKHEVESNYSIIRWEMCGIRRRLAAVESFRKKDWKDLVTLGFLLCQGTLNRSAEHDDHAVTNDEVYEISELVKVLLRFKQSSDAYYFLKGYMYGKEEEFSFCFRTFLEALLAILKPSSTRTGGITYLKRLAVITGLINEASSFHFSEFDLLKPWRRHGANFLSDFLSGGAVELTGDLSMVFRFLANHHPKDKPRRVMPESLDLAGVGEWLRLWERSDRSSDKSQFDLRRSSESVSAKIELKYPDFDDSRLPTVEVGLKLRSEEGALTAALEWSVGGGTPPSHLGIEQILLGTSFTAVVSKWPKRRSVQIAEI